MLKTHDIKYSLFIPVLFLFACSQGQKEKSVFNEASPVTAETEPSWQKEHQKDSIALARLLALALKTSISRIQEGNFDGTIDSVTLRYKNMYAVYSFGNLFVSDKKHLIVKRFIKNQESTNDVYADLFILSANSFSHLFSDTADAGYINDTLMDINGDAFKDYIVSSYSHTGCCPRDSKNAYLYKAANGSFKKEHLFNPEFDPSKRIIYETDYGQPGQITITKYKWNGLMKVELESIFPITTEDNAKQVRFEKHTPASNKAIILRRAPDEYKKLKIYEWFIGGG